MNNTDPRLDNSHYSELTEPINKNNPPPALPTVEEIEAAAEDLKEEVNNLLKVSKLETQIVELKAENKTRDLELRSALLSIVADIERRYGIEARPKKKSFSGGYTSPYQSGG